MKRKDHLYSLGIVVRQNSSPVTAGRGSAVFLHIRVQPQATTSGCIAMAEADLSHVLCWLKAASNPLLVVVPDNEITRIKIGG